MPAHNTSSSAADQPQQPYLQNSGTTRRTGPEFERQVSLSRDGKWLIVKTVRTDILHANYIRAVLDRNGDDAR